MSDVTPEEELPFFDGTRAFEIEGECWIARVAGTGNTGTGAFAHGVLVVVLFHRADEERASRFAYLPRGRLEHLFESELRTLFEEANSVRDPETEPASRPDSRQRADGTVR